MLQKFLGEFETAVETGIGVEGIGQIHNKRGIYFKAHGTREGANATPARRAVDQHFGSANEGDFARKIARAVLVEAAASAAMG